MVSKATRRRGAEINCSAEVRTGSQSALCLRYENHALITGGSTGIGLELAKQFAAHGHDLVLVARQPRHPRSRSREDRRQIRRQSDDHRCSTSPIPTLRSSCSTPSAAEGIDVDFLVNNAGFGLGGEFADTDIVRELDMIQVNVASLVHLTKLFLPPMIKRKQGRIMNVASTAGIPARPAHVDLLRDEGVRAELLAGDRRRAAQHRSNGHRLCPGADRNELRRTRRDQRTRGCSNRPVWRRRRQSHDTATRR